MLVNNNILESIRLAFVLLNKQKLKITDTIEKYLIDFMKRNKKITLGCCDGVQLHKLTFYRNYNTHSLDHLYLLNNSNTDYKDRIVLYFNHDHFYLEQVPVEFQLQLIEKFIIEIEPKFKQPNKHPQNNGREHAPRLRWS